MTLEEHIQLVLAADRTVGIIPELKHSTYFNGLDIFRKAKTTNMQELLKTLHKYGFKGKSMASFSFTIGPLIEAPDYSARVTQARPTAQNGGRSPCGSNLLSRMIWFMSPSIPAFLLFSCWMCQGQCLITASCSMQQRDHRSLSF